MSRQGCSPNEFSTLLHALCDGRLTDDQATELTAQLQADPAARQEFIETIELDTSLKYWAGIEGELQSRCMLATAPAMLVTLPVHEPKRLNSWRLGLAAALASCFLLGLTVGLIGRITNGPQLAFDTESSLPMPEPGMVVAGRILRFSPESQWEATQLAIMRGTYVRPGQVLELKRGVAEVAFGNGATAVLEGPAKLKLNSASEGYLEFGRLAVFDSSSGGTTVLTPSTRLQMKSGELGTAVDDHGVTDVQVFSGSLLAGLVTQRGDVIHQCSLSEGSGRRFNTSTGLISKIGFSRSGYVLNVPESFIAYRNHRGSKGNQAFEGSLGMDFVVKDSIAVTKLGVFDSDADGLKRPLRAELWLRDEAGSAYRFDDDFGVRRIAEMTFTPQEPGMLVQSNRFKPLAKPIVLEPGAYTIVASGYGAEEPNGNEGNPVYDRNSDQVLMVPAWGGETDVGFPIEALKTLDDGAASVLFVGSARWDEVVGQFPRVVDSGAVNRFQAGTFEFERVDQRSSSLPMLRSQEAPEVRPSTPRTPNHAI